jgi:hypothetical protein
MVIGLFGRRASTGLEPGSTAPLDLWHRWGERRSLAMLTLLLSIVVVGFYLLLAPRNYGGWTPGPRWLMWLTPLWLLVLVASADKMGNYRTGRALGVLVLALSVLSAVVADGNPWRHPWIYILLEQTSGPLY